MSEILVLASDGNLGDALMQAPAICGLAAKYDTVYLAMRRRDIQAIIEWPANVVDCMDSEPTWKQQPMETLWLAAGAACGYDVGKEPHTHLIHRFMLRAGLEVDPSVLPQPKVKVGRDDTVVGYDVVLAPWTTAPERTVTLEQGMELFGELNDAIVIGDRRDHKIGFPRGYGWDFPTVVNVLRNARCVVAVDSFPARLAQAVGVEKLILLSTPITPILLQGPAWKFVQGHHEGRQAMWDIAKIVAAVEEALA